MPGWTPAGDASLGDAAVIVTDMTGAVTHWNPAAEALYGWSAAEATGRNVAELLVPATAADEAARIMDLVRSGHSWSGEFEVRRRDGQRLRVRVTDSLLQDAEGRPVGIVGVSIDVTERRKAEQRLAIQYGVAQALADASSIQEVAEQVLRAIGKGLGWQSCALWRVDEAVGAIRCSATWWGGEGDESEFTRSTRSSAFESGQGLPGRVWSTGKPVWIPDIAGDDNFPRAASAEADGLHGGFAFPIALGAQILGVVEAYSRHVEEPDEDLLRMAAAVGSQLGQFIERQEAEEAARATEARRQALLEASLDALVAMDHEGRITEFNPAAEAMFGYTREEAVGQELAALIVPPSLRERHRSSLAEYLLSGQGHVLGRQVEFMALRRDGMEFPVEVAVTRVPLAGPPLFKGSIRDISARRQAEEQLAAILEAEKEARGEAETARQRLAFLSEASTVLASSLDFAEALDRLGRLAVTLLADICLIDVLEDDGNIQRSVAVHADPAKQALTSLLKERHAPRLGGAHPALSVMRSGNPVFSPVMTEQFLRETTRDDEHLRIVTELGFQSYLCVPLVARGRILGTITLVSTNPRHRMGPSDVALAEDLARRTALIVDNVRLYEAEQEARRVAEQAAERTAALQSVTAALGEALTAEQVAEVVVDRGMVATGALAAAVAVLEEEGTLRLVQNRGYGDRLLSGWERFDVAADLPLSEAVRTRRAVFLPSVQARVDRFPALTDRSVEPDHAVACIPLLVEGRAIGGLSLALPLPQSFDHEDEDFLMSLAGQCAQALERARLFEAAQAARAVSEAAERRMAFLAETSAILARGLLDFESTLANVARLAVPDFSDWCAVDLVDDAGDIRRVATAHVDPAKQQVAEELLARHPTDSSATTGVPNVIRTGRSEVMADVPDELLVASIPDPELLETVRHLGLKSAMIVPLIARGRTLGAMTFVSAESGRRYAHPDLVLAEELAQRAALAVDNARLYQDRSHVARALQQTLLPPRLPRIPNVELAALYRPAGEGNEIGGDFYDLFETADGAWAVVIGDVCGKGADAASVIGVTRYTIRALAMQEQRPSRVLGSLNEALRQQALDERFCTVCYVRVRPGPDGVRLTVACAGHPLPFVLRANGSWERVGRPGTLLGVFPDPDIADQAVDLARGDTLLLFTDGVTEERSGSRLFGEDGVAAVLERSAGLAPEELVTNLSEAVVEFRPDAPRDDMAVIALQVTG